ncbi:MAG TPA: BON domain-containing protein [Armatimonadota bacterium]|nr:BON domain-containing protein [Armatimonadota bacterium]
MNRTSDEAITGDVVAALAASPRVRATEVRVHTDRGWVRLEGVVGTLAERNAAEEIAARIPGVLSVENDLVVSSDGTISDLEIEEEAANRLAKENLVNVGVRAEAGTAFLMGVVTSLAAKEQAVAAASTVRGVRDVISELEIAAGEPVDDVTLANDVAEALSDDARIDVMNLEVQASDGSLLLTGEVTHSRQLEIATQVAESVPGVNYVENRMKVRKVGF